MGFLAVISIFALPFFVKQAAVAVSSIIGITVFCAWIAWYLKRPRVCFAFGEWQSIHDGDLPTEPPPGLSRWGKVWVAAAIVASFGLWVGSLMFAVESMFHSSEIYTMTIKEAQSSHCVSNTLGVPITTGWMSTGDINEGINEGYANLNIPLHGSRESGHLELVAEKSDGAWMIKSLSLVHESERIQIEPPDTKSSCH
jgi:hypothetical protein